VKRSMRTIGLGAVAAAFLFTAVACSSDDDDATTTTETTVEESVEATTQNIVEVAVEAGSFGVLASLLTAADLVDALSGDGPFTVFAPTDEAFGNAAADLGISLEELEAYLLDNPDLLTQILQYHVVEGEVLAATVLTLNGQDVDTLSGASFTVNVDEDTNAVSITDGAGRTISVVDVDVLASNGVIHILENVLLPVLPDLS